ncbi:uncharacterized protein LOC100877339 isoform X1 [Megachile rotundata]|uniref:uncharacterized protein LOC100877339 isoform X1 n=1 Tax=Megachile rotundata TaxID=143995 RepID=UPI003FD336AB
MDIPTIDFDSDHRAISISIVLPYTGDLIPFVSPKRPLNYAKTDWKKFQTDLTNSWNIEIPLDRNITNQEIDSFLTEITKTILLEIKRKVPTLPDYNSTELYLNTEIRNLYKIKSSLLMTLNDARRHPTANSTHSISTAKSLLKQCKQKIKYKFQKSVNMHWENKIRNIPFGSQKTFPQVNSIFRKKDSLDIPPLLIKKDKDNLLREANIDPFRQPKNSKGDFIISNKAQKLNVLASNFATANAGNKGLGKPRLSEIIERDYNTFMDSLKRDNENNDHLINFSSSNLASNPTFESDTNYFTTPGYTATLFRKLNCKKSTGPDQIANIVLKKLPNIAIFGYSIIFNHCLNNCYFPEDWKLAKVIPIKKKGKNPEDPNSYRPISLVPNISKVFEILIKERFEKFLEVNKTIPNTQFGFRHKHSTVHALHKFMSDLQHALFKKKSVAACLIDIEKAFDTVWIQGLIFKLLKKKCPIHLVKIIANMIHGKKFFTECNGAQSDLTLQLKNGLQQGTVTAPILFNFYNSELPQLFGLPSSQSIKTIQFADDLVIYIEGKNVQKLQEQLQKLFDQIQDYYKTWKLKINPSKSETILFRKKIKSQSQAFRSSYKNFHISANGTKIPHRRVVRYLGVYFDDLLYLNNHVNIQLEKARKAF